MPDPVFAAPSTRRDPVPGGRGLRSSTAESRRATALADAWAGLPEGVTRWRLVAALRAAAARLGLSSAMLRLVEHYVELSYDQDWAADSEPVICRPLAEIADALDRSERQVRNIERALAARGLLAFRDSGNHVRRGRRDRRSGRLIYAYGPSLAPLGARADEILATAAAARAEIADRRSLRLAIGALRRRVRAELALCTACGVIATDLGLAFAAIPARTPAGMETGALRRIREELQTLADRLAERLDADRATKPAGEEEISDPPSTDTSKQNSINGRSDAKAPAGSTPDRAMTTAARADHGLGLIPLGMALAAAGPTIAHNATRERKGSWSSLADAAHLACPTLGIGQVLWGETCRKLGRGGASIAAIIIERGASRTPGESSGPIRKPDAYLRAMLRRADAHSLRLDRSIRSLAARRVEGCDEEQPLANRSYAHDTGKT